MIKEHIENLPGGKEYIAAQIQTGAVVGIIFMLSIIMTVVIAYIQTRTDYSVYEITTIVLDSCFFGIIFSFIIIILYYKNMYKSDNKYISKIEDIRK